jgi:hypothetical protein
MAEERLSMEQRVHRDAALEADDQVGGVAIGDGIEGTRTTEQVLVCDVDEFLKGLEETGVVALRERSERRVGTMSV